MRLGYASNGFTRVDLERAIDGIAACGYSSIELLADAPHWRPGDPTLPIVHALRSSGLAVSNVNVNTAACLWSSPPPESVFEPSLSNADPHVRGRRLDFTFAAIDLAAEVGAIAVSVTSGRVQNDVPPELGLTFFAESLHRICERASAAGLRVGIEYEPALLVERADEVLGLIAAVDHPALGVNLDIGHAVCMGEDPTVIIPRLAGRIWNVHIEDIRGGKHYHRVPGDGDIDFDAVFASLRDVGYRGDVTVELYTCAAFADVAARRAIEHLSPKLAQALDLSTALRPPGDSAWGHARSAPSR